MHCGSLLIRGRQRFELTYEVKDLMGNFDGFEAEEEEEAEFREIVKRRRSDDLPYVIASFSLFPVESNDPSYRPPDIKVRAVPLLCSLGCVRAFVLLYL